MRIQHEPSRYARRVFVVTLDTDAERALSNEDLLRLCDNIKGIKFNPESQSYSLTGADFGPHPLLGGRTSRSGDTVRVTVYTD